MSKQNSSLVEVVAGGLRWRVLPECQEQLLGPQGLRLDEWLNNGQAHVVKHGPHRTVYRVMLPGLRFYLKHFRLMDTRAWLRQLVRVPKARMEYERARAVAARQVPTVTPVCLGEGARSAGPSESFLLTRSLDNVEPLNEFLQSTLGTIEFLRRARISQMLGKEFGEFIARMHEAGILHDDLHAGNVLLRLEAGDQPRLFLIDLHAVRLGQKLDWNASRANLVILNRWFVLRVSRSDRLRFWHAYWQFRWGTSGQGPDGMSWRDLAHDLEGQTWESNLQFWKSRDRRCLVTNRYYQRIRSPEVTGYAVRDLNGASLDALVSDPDGPFRRPEAKTIKDSPSSTVIEYEVLLNGEPCPVIYKRFRTSLWCDPWTALVRPTGALKSWIYGHGLRERCLPTPRPLVAMQRRRGWLVGDGYLLTVKLPDAVDLRTKLGSLDHADRLVHIEQTARLIRELHRRNLSHRDLKAVNVLVQHKHGSAGGTGPGYGPIWLIDLVGVRRHGQLRQQRRVQNLARLHASFLHTFWLSRTDKLRFLRVYLQWGLHGSGCWKDWWRAIGRATQAKVVRNLKSGRPLT